MSLLGEENGIAGRSLGSGKDKAGTHWEGRDSTEGINLGERGKAEDCLPTRTSC